MGAGPTAVVQAPPAGAPTVGLVLSARRPEGEDDRWMNGFSYEPEGCGDGYITSACSPGANDRALADGEDPPEWEPYVIGDGVRCSSFAGDMRDWKARARRRLEAVTEYQVSREFWTGEQAQAEGLANRYLADVSTLDILSESGSVALTHGLACLEQYLAQNNGGQRGMIHATAQVVTHWATFGLLRREGPRIVTVNDTIVVAGRGYDGTSPDGVVGDSDVWAYATDMVDLRLGPVQDIGDFAEGTAVRRSDNRVEVRAERLAVASWSGCRHGGVRLAVSVCGIGGS